MDQIVGVNLYNQLIEAWNHRDAGKFSKLFSEASICIGFDGSEMNGRSAIFSQLSEIFANHPTARYVTIIRETKMLANDVVLVRAHVGMIPPNGHKIDSSKNAIQILIARILDNTQEIISFQNTPAQYHGRPEAQIELTAELQKVADRDLLAVK
jgi:uncharacterized protein (TIGR02246 family)